MWFKNLRFFRLHPEWKFTTEAIIHALEKQRYHPTGSQDLATIGWAPIADNLPLAFTAEQQILLCAKTDKKLLPATVINQHTREKAQEIEAEQGYRPARKQMQQIKEDITAILLPRAFSVQRRSHVWIDPVNYWLGIDAAAQATADDILTLLGETFRPFPALPVQPQHTPSNVMTQWLTQEANISPFQLEDEAELRAQQDQRAAVRYVRHELDKELLQEHVAQGMYCSRLGLSWADRIAFVLHENLELKKITALEMLTDEQSGEQIQFEDELAANLILMSSELNALLNDLLVALGGEKSNTG